jgi:hypothetical protein
VKRDTRGKIWTGPALRKRLRWWLAAEEEPQYRIEALRIAAEVLALAEEILEQRVLEARAFGHTWADIAAQVGITRQSAHRRWRHLDGPAEELRRQRSRLYMPRRWGGWQEQAEAALFEGLPGFTPDPGSDAPEC